MPPENTKPTWPLNEPGQPPRKVVGAEADSIHIFFELGDGSYLAFFDVPGGGDDSQDPTPWWVKHIAFEVEDMRALQEGKKRLEAHGVQVLGPKDHGMCQSIYFMDPDGHRLEMTVRTEKPDTWQKLENEAQTELQRWNELKRRKYGQLPAGHNSAKDKIPAMPEDSTIAPA
jgi:catechol-2,3-dioxygenase